MATQYSHRIEFDEPIHVTDTHSADDSVVARLLAWVRQRYCGLHGHDTLMQFAKDRMFLQCASCGHETPGWALTETPPKIVVRGDVRRRAAAGPRLVTARRIA
jgi:hypothetical protein